MINYERSKRNEGKFVALTGITPAEFQRLLPAFPRAYARAFPATKTHAGKPRQRRFGGGRKAALLRPEDKLLFILVYLSGTYAGKTHDKKVDEAEAIRYPGRAHFVLPCFSGVSAAQAREVSGFSVTKCQKPLKTAVFKYARPDPLPASGHAAEGHRLPGLRAARAADTPTEKKPRGGELTPEEKAQNRKLSQVRVRVEHSLAGVKCSRSVKDVLRNTKEGFSDLAMVVACGLHNLRVECREKKANGM